MMCKKNCQGYEDIFFSISSLLNSAFLMWVIDELGSWQGRGGREAKWGQMGKRATSAGSYGSPQAQFQQSRSQVLKWVGTEFQIRMAFSSTAIAKQPREHRHPRSRPFDSLRVSCVSSA